jgi:hypothetical protein
LADRIASKQAQKEEEEEFDTMAAPSSSGALPMPCPPSRMPRSSTFNFLSTVCRLQ